MDMQMKHMNGKEAMEHIRDIEKEKGVIGHSYILGATGFNKDNEIFKGSICSGIGFDEIRTKPIHRPVLLTYVDEAFANK